MISPEQDSFLVVWKKISKKQQTLRRLFSSHVCSLNSATFYKNMDKTMACYRAVWDSKDVSLYEVNDAFVLNSPDTCVPSTFLAKYSFFDKKLSIKDTCFPFTVTSFYPFVLETMYLDRHIQFTEPKTQINYKMKYEARLLSKSGEVESILTNHYCHKFLRNETTFLVSKIRLTRAPAFINPIGTNLKQFIEMDQKQFFEFLFLMCVVTNVGRVNSMFFRVFQFLLYALIFGVFVYFFFFKS